MAEQIPITPEIIKWARERAGLTVDEARQKFRRFEEWEKGSSFPSYSQLEQLAELFKVPVGVFFFPSPPTVTPIDETFRTLPNAEFSKLPSRLRLLLRKAKAMQLNLHELAEGQNPAERLITRDLSFPLTSSIAAMASVVREYLGVSIAQQQSWRDNGMAMKEWRSALLNSGVFIFKDAFRIDEFSGFCLYDKVFPIIYVNNSSAKTRQMFTYFHELAHLLFHTSGIDTVDDSYISRLQNDDKLIEVNCNRFAAEFLLPDKHFELETKRLPDNETTAEVIASKYHVSREVVFRRFLDHGRISERQYKEAVKKWSEQQQQHKEGSDTGGDYYWTKLSYLGREYVTLALTKFHQNRIDENQLADYLDVKPKNVSTLAEYFGKGGDG